MLDAYPSITECEFRNASEAFEKRCHDQLDSTSWLSVKWTGAELLIKEQRTLAVGGGRSQDDVEVIEITNDVVVEDIQDERIATVCLCLNLRLRASAHSMQLDKSRRNDELFIEVDFSITLSPTYAVPILWMRSSSINNIDQLYEMLIPSEQRDHTRNVSVMGGLSQAVSAIQSDPYSLLMHAVPSHLGSAVLLRASVQHPPGPPSSQ